jgi:hypothetical protein
MTDIDGVMMVVANYVLERRIRERRAGRQGPGRRVEAAKGIGRTAELPRSTAENTTRRRRMVMKLQRSQDRVEPWGMAPRDPDPPVTCPECGKPLVMQGALYWCADCEQGYKDTEWGDN